MDCSLPDSSVHGILRPAPSKWDLFHVLKAMHWSEDCSDFDLRKKKKKDLKLVGEGAIDKVGERREESGAMAPWCVHCFHPPWRPSLALLFRKQKLGGRGEGQKKGTESAQKPSQIQSRIWPPWRPGVLGREAEVEL